MLILIDNALSTKEVPDGVKQSVVGAVEASLLSCMTYNIEGVGAAIDGLEAGHLAMVHCQGEYILLSHLAKQIRERFSQMGQPLQRRKAEEQDVKAECDEEEQRQSTMAWVQIILFARQHRFTHK
jgi:hypothetical protein